MPDYWITYDTTATLMFRVEAENEEQARRRWQNDAPFDFDHTDFVEASAGTDKVQLRRLEMRGQARRFEVTEVREHKRPR